MHIGMENQSAFIFPVSAHKEAVKDFPLRETTAVERMEFELELVECRSKRGARLGFKIGVLQRS